MRDWLKEIAAMVAGGDTDGLPEAVSKSLEEIEREIAGLQRQATAIRGLGDCYAPTGEASLGTSAITRPADGRSDTSTAKKRWWLIHEAALAAVQGKEVLDVKDVEGELRRKGVELHYRNVGAAIGTVLRDSREFQRIGTGLWKLIGVEGE